MTIEISERTVLALDREAESPDIEVHRRFIEARNLRRLADCDGLLSRIDDVLKATA